MNLLMILMPICLIIQQIQIFLLRKEFQATQDLVFTSLADKLKVTVMELTDEDEDDEDD